MSTGPLPATRKCRPQKKRLLAKPPFLPTLLRGSWPPDSPAKSHLKVSCNWCIYQTVAERLRLVAEKVAEIPLCVNSLAHSDHDPAYYLPNCRIFATGLIERSESALPAKSKRCIDTLLPMPSRLPRARPGRNSSAPRNPFENLRCRRTQSGAGPMRGSSHPDRWHCLETIRRRLHRC